MVVKLHFPDAQHVVGIATETHSDRDYRSEDLFLLDATEWNSELEQEARKSKADLGIFTDVKTFASRVPEYPVTKSSRVVVSRNSACLCGSRKRYKNCCGKGMFSKKKGKLFRKR